MGIAFGGYDESDDWYRNYVSWQTTCKSDPRFNLSGQSASVWSAMAAVDTAIRARATALGLSEEQIPEDIEYGGFKR